jgi:transcriptional regulator with XRE-family HTH domain
MNFNLQILIDTIRERRIHLNYKQEYVAAKLGVSQNAYSKLELGRSQLTVKRLMQVCQILEADVCEMLRPALKAAV